MGRPRKIKDVTAVADQWLACRGMNENYSKGMLARAFRTSRSTIVRALRDAVTAGLLPPETFKPILFRKPSVECKAMPAKSPMILGWD